MAGIKKMVPGQTLIEVMVALVIIMATFFVFCMIYLNISRTTLSVNDFKANMIAQDVSESAILHKTYIDDKQNVNGYSVTKNFSYFKNDQGILELNLSIADSSGKSRSKYQKLIKL